jgi:hypothetical protein
MLVLTSPRGKAGDLNELLSANGQGPQKALNVELLSAEQSAIGLDGSVSNVLTLLPAGHAAGFYLLITSNTRRLSGSGGTFSQTISYTDPLSGLISFAKTTTQALSGTPATPLIVSQFAFKSTGDTAITLTTAFQSPAGTIALDVYASLLRAA